MGSSTLQGTLPYFISIPADKGRKGRKGGRPKLKAGRGDLVPIGDSETGLPENPLSCALGDETSTNRYGQPYLVP